MHHGPLKKLYASRRKVHVRIAYGWVFYLKMTLFIYSYYYFVAAKVTELQNYMILI